MVMVAGSDPAICRYGNIVCFGGTVNKSSQLGDSEVLIKQHSEAVFPWIGD